MSEDDVCGCSGLFHDDVCEYAPEVCANCGKIWDMHYGPEDWCSRFTGDRQKRTRFEPEVPA